MWKCVSTGIKSHKVRFFSLTKRGVERSRGCSRYGCLSSSRVETVGIESRDKSSSVGKPETAKGTEDDRGETVSENPLKDGAGEHEKTAHEEVNATVSQEIVRKLSLVFSRALRIDLQDTYIVAAPSPPAPRQPMRSQDRGVRESKKPTRALTIEKRKLISTQILNLTTSME